MAEPTYRIRYPRKLSIKTEDASLTLLKNDLPWTLHPLPPPLPTSKAIRLEVEKSMPWALHPLPPPMKTKTYSDYYWPGARTRPKPPPYRGKYPKNPNRYAKHTDHKHLSVSKPTATAHTKPFKPSVGYEPADDDRNHADHAPVDYEHADYNHVDSKSPDYPKSENEDDGDRGQHTYRDPSQPPSSEYVSHITIEPSVQIASFSETELLGDGTNRETISENDASKRKCRCTINGHRHKRDADDTAAAGVVTITETAVRTQDSNAEQSSRNAYVGHATDIQILKSHDISDQSTIAADDPTAGYVQQVRGLNANPRRPPANGNREQPNKFDATTFRDDSDRFKVDFGRQINSWDESKSTADKGRLSPLQSDDGGGHDNDDYGYRLARKPNQGIGYRVTQSKVEDSGGGVAFSVQTPFSVSSFSSNVRHPATRERQSRFRYTDDKTTSTSPFQSEYSAEPLDFEQFGLQSALEQEDKPRDSGLLLTVPHFSTSGFNEKPAETISQWTQRFPEGFGGGDSGLPGRPASHFLRDDGDRSRSKPFRYNAKPSPSDRFGGRLRGDRPSSGGDASVLEFFQPVVVDFDKKPRDGDDFKPFGNSNGAGDRSRYFGKTDSAGFSKFKKDQNPDQLRLPGRLHESNENLSRKMIFHPSTFDTD